MRTGYALRPVSLYNTVHTDSFTATIIIIIIVMMMIIIIYLLLLRVLHSKTRHIRASQNNIAKYNCNVKIIIFFFFFVFFF